MLQTIKAAWLSLATINADLPWFCVALSAFALVYLLRKFAPKAWLAFEARSPFHFADPAPVMAALHKAFQAIPSMLLSAAMTAIGTGGDFKKTALGLLVGLIPPVLHELLAWAPFLPYKGAVGGTKTDGVDDTTRIVPMLVLLIVGLVLPQQGCSRLAAVNWPKQLGECAAPLEPGLLKSVGAVLAGTGDVESDLAGIVQSGAAADAVECAVAQLVGDIGLRPAEARESRQAERGRAFLAKVHQ